MSTVVAAPSARQLEKFVCIASIGHSGSTLVGMLLDQYPECTSMGEITNLHKFTAQPDMLCGCGTPVLKCPFWLDVEAELRRKTGNLSLKLGEFSRPTELKKTAFRKLPALSELLMIWGSPTAWRLGSLISPRARREREFGERAVQVYEAIAAVRGTPITVNSAGSTTQMKSIYLADPTRFRAINVIRDGRGWTCSQMRREKSPMETAVKLFVRRHWNTELMMRSIPENQRMVVRYEDLCRDTPGTMLTISRFLDVDTQLTDFTLKKTEFHGVGGNPMRFRYDESTVQLDEKWRRDLTPADLELFENIGGETNRRLGYTD
jgi:hypothetical protein